MEWVINSGGTTGLPTQEKNESGFQLQVINKYQLQIQ